MASTWTGRTLGGRYKIIELLGQGGMSAVYKASDLNLHRTVAVKLIHPHLSTNPDFLRRFEEEATGVAHLRHPNIVQVYDFNHEEDAYYMVMEYLLGETLQARLKRLNTAGRRLPLQDAVRYTGDVCKAAEYAHQRGIIHRDIKPANIMIDVHNTAILMDFGIARMVGGSQHTATGAVLGTALYMSPEQIQGLQPDARADVYSLGVALFEMLSGHPPYEADSAMTLMMMHLHDPIPDLRVLNPVVLPELVSVVNKALAKNRDQRYPSAAALASELECLPSPLPYLFTQEAAAPTAPAPATPVTASTTPTPDATLIEAAANPAPPLTAPIPPAPAAPEATLVESAASLASIASAAPLGLDSTFVEPAPSRPVTHPTPVTPPPVTPPPPAAGAVAQPAGKRSPWIFLVVLLLAAIAGVYIITQGLPGTRTPSAEPPAALLPAGTSVPVVAPGNEPTATRQSSPTLEPNPTAEPSASIAPAATQAPSATTEPSATAEPSATLEPTATSRPALPVVGGADQIAFFSGGDIWTANIDGSGLTQLTKDGAAKTYLRWLPAGDGLTYISGKCIQSVSLAGVLETITCFNAAEFLESFEVSPDGQRLALSLDHLLYLLPFDLSALRSADRHSDLQAMATCPALAPYERNAGRYARWSADSKRLAVVVMGVLKDGRRGDLVQVFSVDECIPNPLVSVQFPEPHFSYGDYDRNPVLQDIAWDGRDLFILHGNTRNDGFGDLFVFNTETFRFSDKVNPVSGVCCYRDPQFSPDGSYLIFAFQDYGAGASSVTQLFYIPFGSIGSGAAYQPLPIPALTNPREQPQPALRPASP